MNIAALRVLIILTLLIFCGVIFLIWKYAPREYWAVYYGNTLSGTEFQNFDLIVFDSDEHPPIAPLKESGKTVLGYISLGEADPKRGFYFIFAQNNLLLPKDPIIVGRNVIDIRKPEWRNYVLDVLIPSITAQGFDGIMIDTLDSVIQPEVDDPVHYSGMQDAAVNLVSRIHQRYPAIKIMVNRGFEILPRISRDINMVLAESIYSTVHPGTKEHVILPAEEYRHYVDILTRAKAASPALKIYSLDYWPPADRLTIETIYSVQRESGFIPYVSTQDLQSVYKEP